MAESRVYLVPDYYPAFSCKLGRCRACCCTGWPVSLSLQDYYHLLGIPCKKTLRAKLDCALKPLPNPTNEKYAELAHRFDGDCPLRMADGRCAIHAELGENSLPNVCRLYPRAVRGEGNDECSCANSCEAVVELLLCHEAPLSFVPRSLRFDLPRQAERTVFFESVGHEQEIRLALIRILQNRSLQFPQRFSALWQTMRALEPLIRRGDEAAVERLLQAPSPQPVPVQGNPPQALQTVQQILATLSQQSAGLRACRDTALAAFGGDCAPEAYEQAAARFTVRFPLWPSFFENLLVNHLFFTRFPFVEARWDFPGQFAALCTVYGLLRLLAIGACAGNIREGETKQDTLVDVVAGAFRVIDHTLFHRRVTPILRDLGLTTPEEALQLTIL